MDGRTDDRELLRDALAALADVVDRQPVSAFGDDRQEVADALTNAARVLGAEDGDYRSPWRAGYESGIGEGRKQLSTEKMLGRFRVFDPKPLARAIGALDAAPPFHLAPLSAAVIGAARDILEAAEIEPVREQVETVPARRVTDAPQA